jgi:hypothetical protein
LLPARPSPTPSVVSLRHDSGDLDTLASYWAFYWAVAAAQLAHWLPRRPARILDISGLRARCAPRRPRPATPSSNCSPARPRIRHSSASIP